MTVSKRNQDILLAKIETLQNSVPDDVIRSICNILLDIVKADNGQEIGFKTKLEQGEK